jgi:hypothetical protein
MTQSATSISQLATLTASAGEAAYLTEDGREGMFAWNTANLAAEVSADPLEGIYVPPSSATSGASGAWVRVPEAPGVVQLDWFGANGDGVTSDTSILVTAVDTIRALRGLGVVFHELRFSGCKTYYLAALSTNGPALLNFGDFTVEANGAELKLAPTQGGTTVFKIGNDSYETGVAEGIPENITVRGFKVDFVQNGSAQSFCNIAYPCRTVLIERNHGYQSNPEPDEEGKVPYAGGDAWFISINPAGLPSDATNSAVAAADDMARAHELTIRDNVVRNQLQLTGNGGRGVNGLTIVRNEVYDPRANGIAVTSVGRICRLENVLIAHNKVYRATGRGIYVQNDNIGDTQALSIAGMQTYQNYARNVVICDNLVEDCDEGIRTGTYIQGFHGLVIDDNVVRSTSTENDASAIRIQSNAYRWAAEYWLGSDPVIQAASFDAANDRVTFTINGAPTAHNLPPQGGIRIRPVTGGSTNLMPGGICAHVPYFFKKVDANSIELYESIEPQTGTLSNKVDIQAGATGSFTVSYCGFATDVRIGSGNLFISRNDGRNILADMRTGRVGGLVTARTSIGSLADVDFEVDWRVPGPAILVDRGGTLRVTVGGSIYRRSDAAAGSDRVCIRAEYGDTAHYDLSFIGTTFEGDFLSSPDRTSPTGFYSETVATTVAARLGPGVRFIGCSGVLAGTPTGVFVPLSSTDEGNCARWKNNDFQMRINSAIQTGVNPQTADYTLRLHDIGRRIEMSSASARVITVPPHSTMSAQPGDWIDLKRLGTGSVTVAAGSGVTIRVKAGLPLTLAAQYSSARLIKSSTANTWDLEGDLG